MRISHDCESVVSEIRLYLREGECDFEIPRWQLEGEPNIYAYFVSLGCQVSVTEHDDDLHYHILTSRPIKGTAQSARLKRLRRPVSWMEA